MDISEATEVLLWNSRMLDFLGLWPLNLSNVKFTFCFTYITIQCSLQYADLVEYISDLNYVVVNLTETMIINMTFFKITIYRIFSKQLREIIQNIQEDYSKEEYNTDSEIKFFMRYNIFSKKVVQTFSVLCGSCTFLFYIQPLSTQLLTSHDQNSSSSFLLPFHIRLFFDLTETRTYYIIYACQIFVVPIVTCGFIGTYSLLIILVLHICGQFSVLTSQVENIMEDPEHLPNKIKRIVLKHRRLIRLFENLQSAYSAFLLQELFGYTALTCLSSYNVIATPILEDITSSVKLVMYMVSIFTQLFGFCYIGECLLTEFSESRGSSSLSSESRALYIVISKCLIIDSENCLAEKDVDHISAIAVDILYNLFIQAGIESGQQQSACLCNAFYHCKWYNVPPDHAKLFVMCILQSQKPLTLTAGKFFTFSLASFTDVVKTSMAYLSVMREFI